MDDGKTTGIGAFAFLLGGMLGAAIGILYAPRGTGNTPEN